MKKILVVLILCCLSSNTFSMDPDAATAAKFQKEPQFKVLADQASVLKSATGGTAVRDTRRWFAQWAELVNTDPEYRKLTQKPGGMDKLFGTYGKSTVGDTALQQKANVSLGSLLVAYDNWGVGKAKGPGNGTVKALQDQVADLQGKLKTAKDTIAAGITDPAVKKQINDLQSQLTAANKEIADLKQKAPGLPEAKTLAEAVTQAKTAAKAVYDAIANISDTTKANAAKADVQSIIKVLQTGGSGV